MRNSSWLRACVSGVALAMVVGCTKNAEMPPMLGDEGSTIDPHGGAKQDGGKLDGGEGGAATGDGGVCAPIANNATPVAERYVGDTLPLPMGGTIASGTYFLTAINSFTGIGGNVGPTGSIYTETTTFDSATSTRADVVQIDVNDGGTGSPMPSSATYATSGTSVTFAATCGASPGNYTYSVLGSTLHLYLAPHELVFTLQ